jgi:hypothetical protein
MVFEKSGWVVCWVGGKGGDESRKLKQRLS